jgi:diadenylate cyclase
LTKGLVLLGLGYFVISALNMKASTFILQRLFSSFIIVLIILYQPEIRHALENVGGSRFKNFSILSGAKSENIRRDEATKDAINVVCRVCNDLSPKKIGAIIVFEKDILLGEVIKTGTLMDAVVTQELVANIFFPMSPLHDGAAIIRSGRIYAAGCILPLTENNSLSRDLGTRHRAALGLSEQSDAVIIIVSEETGCISAAYKGTLERDISYAVLREKLMNYLILADSQNQNDTGRIKQLFRGFKK